MAKAEYYVFLIVVLTFSAMGLSLYSQCESCNNSTAKNLYHVFLTSTIVSAVVIVGLFAYDNRRMIGAGS